MKQHTHRNLEGDKTMSDDEGLRNLMRAIVQANWVTAK